MHFQLEDFPADAFLQITATTRGQQLTCKGSWLPPDHYHCRIVYGCCESMSRVFVLGWLFWGDPKQSHGLMDGDRQLTDAWGSFTIYESRGRIWLQDRWTRLSYVE
jgi:hypothetical protein